MSIINSKSKDIDIFITIVCLLKPATYNVLDCDAQNKDMKTVHSNTCKGSNPLYCCCLFKSKAN